MAMIPGFLGVFAMYRCVRGQAVPAATSLEAAQPLPA
jgi:hypothetical protein